MQSFTPDAARAHGQPFVDQRVAAAERAGDAPLPTPAEEIWRYSRIDELDLDAFGPGIASTTVEGGDGIVVEPDDLPDIIGAAAPDVFAELNTAFMTPVVVRVPKGHTHGATVVVTHTVGGSGRAVFPRLVVDAGEDSNVTIVERFVSAGDDVALVVPVLQVRAAQAARVQYLGVNELSSAAWQIGHQQAVGDRDSTVTLATVALGGYYARVRTEARISGAGGSTRQVALYFAGGEQMHDFRTIQDHDAPHTTSDLLFKGAVQDHSRSVYTGLIKIRKHARGTTAFQTNRNLTLSEGAWAESVPNLEIETNDVRCSHASTVGPIDPEHRFYLESRGIPTQIAERLIVLGFFDEVLD
ncbi:MAG: Fe-S cluster assembly protein SufD, partial [Actinomycetota bacterium]|nr:Fe-S cluster assembly protein SufD [Actinomycetota bacterium]